MNMEFVWENREIPQREIRIFNLLQKLTMRVLGRFMYMASTFCKWKFEIFPVAIKVVVRAQKHCIHSLSQGVKCRKINAFMNYFHESARVGCIQSQKHCEHYNKLVATSWSIYIFMPNCYFSTLFLQILEKVKGNKYKANCISANLIHYPRQQHLQQPQGTRPALARLTRWGMCSSSPPLLPLQMCTPQ